MVWPTDEECLAENALRAPTSMGHRRGGWKLRLTRGAVHRAHLLVKPESGSVRTEQPWSTPGWHVGTP